MKYLISFLVIFILVFLADLIFIKKPIFDRESGKKKKSKKKKKDFFELNYVVTKFKLDKKKMPIKKCIIHFALINAFIIALTVTILDLLDVFIALQLLIGFVLLFGLIYACYELYGRFCVKKGWEK